MNMTQHLEIWKEIHSHIALGNTFAAKNRLKAHHESLYGDKKKGATVELAKNQEVFVSSVGVDESMQIIRRINKSLSQGVSRVGRVA